MTIKVLICDDEQDFSKEIATQLADVFIDETFSLLPAPSPKEITTNIQILLDRQTDIREGKLQETKCLFDNRDTASWPFPGVLGIGTVCSVA